MNNKPNKEEKKKLLGKGLKYCSSCKEIKSVNYFGSNKRASD